MIESVWEAGRSVHITSFWGWGPETWGTVGYSRAGRRDTVVRTTTDPFIVVGYVTKQVKNADPETKGKITGFYLVSHTAGHRDEFTASHHHGQNAEKWQHSLKAIRAFSFLPEYRMLIDEFDATITNRALAVAQYGEEVSPENIERLKRIPFVEVPVFGGSSVVDSTIHAPRTGRHKVKAGPVNRSGYIVDGEPIDTEKELYALILKGDTDAFLGEPALGRHIFKIGLSISPKTRLDAFGKTLPRGAFSWRLYRTTRDIDGAPYPDFETAEAGENAMKDSLGQNKNWLGGEFYAATNELFDAAWWEGRNAAVRYQKAKNNATF